MKYVSTTTHAPDGSAQSRPLQVVCGPASGHLPSGQGPRRGRPQVMQTL